MEGNEKDLFEPSRQKREGNIFEVVRDLYHSRIDRRTALNLSIALLVVSMVGFLVFIIIFVRSLN